MTEKQDKKDKSSYFELIVRRDLLKDDKTHLDEPHQVGKSYIISESHSNDQRQSIIGSN